MDPRTELLLGQALEEFTRGLSVRDEGGWLRASALVIADDDPRELIPFLEEVAEDATGLPVLVEGPVLDPALPDMVRERIRRAAETRDDVVRVSVDEASRTLTVVTRHQELFLGRKRNRLPKLRKELDGTWSVEAKPMGTQVDVADLVKIPATQAFLAPFLPPEIPPSEVHAARPVTRRQELHVKVDAPDIAPIEFRRLERTVRWTTDIDLRIEHRISKARAQKVVGAAFAELPHVTRYQVKWVDKPGGVSVKVDAEHTHKDGLDRLVKNLGEQIGVTVSYVFDAGRELMVDRIAADFPAEGILTGLRHVDGPVYEVEALLPLEPPTTLEAWSDAMEEKWGLELHISDPYLHAPDLRYRDELGADKETIARRYNRPGAFTDVVGEQARTAAGGWDMKAEIADGTRRDIRDVVVMSIDPVRTKDLDDALSIEPAGEGIWRVGVHIADVGPFVPQDSPLDREALRRSFTTYLAEGEIPVLPPVLADEVNSLHGGQDSPALSLFIRMTDAGEVLDTELAHTVIHNHHRWAYAGAQAVLDGAEHHHAEALLTLNRLARTLRASRKAAGALDLSLEEDPEKESHQLIEEFMLLANECVARFLVEHHPVSLCLYRTHPEVPPTAYTSLNRVAEYLRCPVEVRDQATMQEALEYFVAQPDRRGYRVFRFHVGRVLEKATYHFEQLGHGALNKLYYAHFTSPIRRYSDLIVHRLIDDALAWMDDPSGDPYTASSYLPEDLYSVCDHLNAMEIRVNAGSFESHRLDDLRRFDRGGRGEQGIVVGLMRGRVAVDLETTDLRVSVRYRSERWIDEDMPVRVDDENTGLSFRLGQEVTVKTRGVDWARKTIDAVIMG